MSDKWVAVCKGDQCLPSKTCVSHTIKGELGSEYRTI